MNKAVRQSKWLVSAALVSLTLGLGLVACGGGGGGGGKPSGLAGQWVCVNGEYEIDLLKITDMELSRDGTATFEDVVGKWDVVDKRLVLSVTILGTELRVASNYNLSGYELTLIDKNDYTTVFVKKEKLEEYKAKQAAKK